MSTNFQYSQSFYILLILSMVVFMGQNISQVIGVVVAEDTETAHAAAKLVKARQKQKLTKIQKLFQAKESQQRSTLCQLKFYKDPANKWFRWVTKTRRRQCWASKRPWRGRVGWAGSSGRRWVVTFTRQICVVILCVLSRDPSGGGGRRDGRWRRRDHCVRKVCHWGSTALPSGDPLNHLQVLASLGHCFFSSFFPLNLSQGSRARCKFAYQLYPPVLFDN